MINVALFPIPGCVAFPGMDVPLHVFEPRYRKMVDYCLEQQLPIAVCHTLKVVQEKPPQDNVKEALKTNQSTYKPCPIFSAGHVELIDTLNDGRLAIQIHAQHRLQLIHERQNLPFIIGECEAYEDLPLSDAQQQHAQQLKHKILARLNIITHEVPVAQALLNGDEWQHKDVTAFSFELFNFLQIPPDISQAILESRDVCERLEDILHLLNHHSDS